MYLIKKDIIEAVKELSNIIGINNLYVRYDPIFMNDKYNLEYHKKAFDRLCSLLDGYINKIIVSFIDDYKNVRKNEKILNYRKFTDNDYREIGLSFSRSVNKYNMSVQTCFEDNTLVEYGFIKGECLSHELAYKLTGKAYKKWTARKGNKCNCVNLVDIGYYNSCKHLCKYCYANYNEIEVNSNFSNHNPNSSLLIGELKDDDVIKVRYK